MITTIPADERRENGNGNGNKTKRPGGGKGRVFLPEETADGREGALEGFAGTRFVNFSPKGSKSKEDAGTKGLRAGAEIQGARIKMHEGRGCFPRQVQLLFGVAVSQPPFPAGSCARVPFGGGRIFRIIGIHSVWSSSAARVKRRHFARRPIYLGDRSRGNP